MNRNILLGILLTILILSLFVACSKDKENYLKYSYKHEETSFSFEYPENWVVEIEPRWPGDSEAGIEASPDDGVSIYIDGDNENCICIFGSYSPILYDPPDDINLYRRFESKIDNIEKMDIIKSDERIYYIVFKETEKSVVFYNAVVNVNENFYSKHEDIIWHILGSVEIK
ncbi:hypothetical protein [Caloranaerobacter sp. DY30410]|uniref:hypothetical protein n=1 Tax=Caloranaerobacter sp. DY30410 TaxID=3238305 RepID=UPI003D045545